MDDGGKTKTPEIKVLPPAKTLRVDVDIDRGGRGAIRLRLVRHRKSLRRVARNVGKPANKLKDGIWAEWYRPKAPNAQGKVTMEKILIPEGQLPSCYQEAPSRASDNDRLLVQNIFDQKRLAGSQGRTMEFKRMKVAVAALIAGTESAYDVEELYSIYGVPQPRTAGRVVPKVLKDPNTGTITRAPVPLMAASNREEETEEDQDGTEEFAAGTDAFHVELEAEAHDSDVVHVDGDIAMPNIPTAPMTTDADDSNDLQLVYQFDHSTKTQPKQLGGLHFPTTLDEPICTMSGEDLEFKLKEILRKRRRMKVRKRKLQLREAEVKKALEKLSWF